MSWQATSWAKRTRGHANSTDKLLLMILSDYAHPETWEAWPTQAVLAEDMECSMRTVRRGVARLAAGGFLDMIRVGANRPNKYRLKGADTLADPTDRPSVTKG